MHKIANILFDLGTNDYLLPYLRRELETLIPAPGEPEPEPVAGVRVVRCDADSPSPEFTSACADLTLPVLALHCPAIVCTGMQGLPRRIAEGIYRGRYVQIAGSDARISVVHGVDVARAAVQSAGVQGTFTLTDCCDPSVAELADALAMRLGGKRLFTIRPRWARMWYGSEYFETLTTSHTAPCTYCQAFPDFRPHSVVEYLKTHVYDESSL